jgi:hypothetical protein
LSGGNSMRRGVGGVTRRRSQIAGRAIRAPSTSGAAKLNGRPSMVRLQPWRKTAPFPAPASPG